MNQTQLQEKLNKILVDIVSVTDEIRIEQLREQYLEVETELEKTTYKNLYYTTSLSDALEKTNNINLSQLYKKYKLRPLTTLDNTRVLVSFLSASDSRLVIKDMQDVIVDTIGKGSTIYTIYIYCLSKYELNMTPCIKNN